MMEPDEQLSWVDGWAVVLAMVGVLAVLAMVGYALWHLWAVVAG